VVFPICASPLSSKRLVPAVPRKSLHPIHALSTPVAICPVIRHPTDFIPEAPHASGFDDIWILNDASSKGLLSFVSRLRTCSRYYLALFLQRSPPWPFTTAAWRGLRPAPESRSRGAHPHLLHSFTTYLPPFRLSLQHTRAQKYSPSCRMLINVMQPAEYRLCDNLAVGPASSDLEDCRITGRLSLLKT
jgi:hypothetical protein